MKRLFKTLLVLLLVLMPITFASAKKTTTTTAAAAPGKVNIYVFYGNGCPHCADLEEYVKNTLRKDSRVKDMFEVIYYETWYDSTNQQFLTQVANYMNMEIKGVPFVLIGDQYFSGYGSTMNEEIVSTIQKEAANAKYTDVVANVVAATNITPVQSYPEDAIEDKDGNKDSKKNDVIGIIILGVTVVIILAIIFTRHADDSDDEEDEEVEEEKTEEKVEEKPKAVKKTTSTKKKTTKKKTTKK